MRWIAALVLIALLGLLPKKAAAEMPPHLVLARPQATGFRTPYSPPIRVLAQPYPYGYFGVSGRTQWQRQFGIHRTYTQWSQK